MAITAISSPWYILSYRPPLLLMLFPTFFPDFRDMMDFWVARYLLNELHNLCFKGMLKIHWIIFLEANGCAYNLRAHVWDTYCEEDKSSASIHSKSIRIWNSMTKSYYINQQRLWHEVPVLSSTGTLWIYSKSCSTHVAQNIFFNHPMFLNGYETCLCPKIIVILAWLRSVRCCLLSHSSSCPILTHKV